MKRVSHLVLITALITVLICGQIQVVDAQQLFNRLFSFFRSAAPEEKPSLPVGSALINPADVQSVEVSMSPSKNEVSVDVPTTTSSSSSSLASSTFNKEIHTLLSKARGDVERREYRAAVETYMSILENDPMNVEANGLLGATFVLMNEPKLAEGFLFMAVKQSNWSDLIAINNLAECLRLNGDFDLAEKTAIRGLSSDPTKDATGLLSYTLGNIYLSKQNYGKAADWFLAAAIKQSNKLDTWLRASTLQFPQQYHDYKFAENTLLEAVTKFPDSVVVYYYLGVTMFNTRRYPESIAFLEKGLLVDPQHQESLRVLQMARDRANPLQKADFRAFQKGFQ